MLRKTIVATCLIGFCGSAVAQDDDAEKKRLETEVAIAKAQNDLLLAKYPKFDGGKAGATEGAEKLSSMALQHLPISTSLVGEAVGIALLEPLPAGKDSKVPCASGTVVLSGSTLSEKVASAMSLAKQIDALQEAIDDALIEDAIVPPKSDADFRKMALAPIVPALTALASYAGMFRADYTVSGSPLNVDMDWLAASIVLSAPGKLESERFPSSDTVDKLVKKLTDMKTSAGEVNDPKQRKELTDRVDALRKALFTPGDDKLLPIVATALLYTSSTGEGIAPFRKCLAVITSATASPMLLSKQTAFSKGGRAYLYFPLQVSAIQMDEHGAPVRRICKISTVSTSLKLSKLTKNAPEDPPWSNSFVRKDDDCATLPAPKLEPKTKPKIATTEEKTAG